MGKLISMETRNELLRVPGLRYREGNTAEKGKILDEFTKVSGYHRKHAIRLLSTEKEEKVIPPSRKIYDETVAGRHTRRILELRSYRPVI